METKESHYIKRTQKDYSMPFKLSVVRELETTEIGLCAVARKYGIQSETTVKRWLEKYGNFDLSNQSYRAMEKNKEQKLLELEQKVKLLERRNARLEKELEAKDMKADFFDLMIDIAEKEYKIDIRKNSYPEQSTNTKK